MAKLNCVTVLAPAKLNLALDVVGLLPNGYHNLDMTMQAITALRECDGEIDKMRDEYNMRRRLVVREIGRASCRERV